MRMPVYIALLISIFLSGCGERKIQVTGKVLLKNGKPLPGGMLVLSPEAGGLKGGARAYLETDGTFVLSTDAAGDGIISGKYKVLVVHPPKKGGEDAPSGPMLFHPKYSDFATSGLVVDITPENHLLEITLDPPSSRN